MKRVLAVLLLVITGCSNPEKKGNESMAGAYRMMSQRIKSDKTDTTYTSRQQLKIFSEDFMMYAHVTPPDSVGSFGIGSYDYIKDTVSESIIYTASDSTSSINPGTYKLFIKKTDKGYIQIIPNIMSEGTMYELTEEYEAVGTASKSSLDGTWKKIKRLEIHGTDTTVHTGDVQFKAYYAGHVIWGDNWTDTLNENHTAIGFGKFEMTGNKVKESMMESTYAAVRGHDFDIEIEMMGVDDFKQTITNADGSKSVEFYQRLKK
jgi:hypothetical protein